MTPLPGERNSASCDSLLGGTSGERQGGQEEVRDPGSEAASEAFPHSGRHSVPRAKAPHLEVHLLKLITNCQRLSVDKFKS